MIYDDQSQMVEAMWRVYHGEGQILETLMEDALPAAFAAIDREALAQKIEFARDDRYWSLPPRERIKADLVAAGIIPKREPTQRPDPDGMPQSQRWGH